MLFYCFLIFFFSKFMVLFIWKLYGLYILFYYFLFAVVRRRFVKFGKSKVIKLVKIDRWIDR